MMPKFTLLCYAIMMGIVAYGHHLLNEPLAPPLILAAFSLVCIVTWPAPTDKVKSK